MVCFAALVVGFSLFLWKSNLVPETIKGLERKEVLLWQDVWWYHQYLMVDIKWSKTLQYQEHELSLPLKPAKNGVICAVQWIRWLLARPGSGSDLLFSIRRKGQLEPITYAVLSTHLKQWAKLSGKNETDFTLHGLRREGQ